MEQEPENIRSADAEMLTEINIEYPYDEELTVPQFAGKSKLMIGTLGNDIVVSSIWRNSGKASGDVVFERGNGLAICDAIDKVLSAETPWEERVEIADGKDKITVSFSSSWPHNTTAPLERVQVINRRNYTLDGLESHIVYVLLPPTQAKKFADELRLVLDQPSHR